MKLNNIIKVLLATAVLAAFNLNANAQFNNLGQRIKQKAQNKVRQTVENAADNAVNSAVNRVEREAKKQINMTVEYKTQLSAPQINAGSSINELYEAFDYWATLTEMANKKKDLEWLCSEKGEKMTEILNIIQNRDDKNSSSHSLTTTQSRHAEIAKGSQSIIFPGYPKSEDFSDNNQFLASALKWYVTKANKGKKNAKSYYTINGAATRYLAFCTDRYTDTPEIQKITADLCKLYEQVPESYKAKYPNANPYKSYDAIKAEYAAEQKAAAERRAAAEAKRKADIEASKQTLKPGALNKSLNSQVYKVAKEKFPDCIKVVIENDSWTVKREGGAIARRTLLAWVVTKDKEGNLVAHDYGFAQEYMGGGKYGNLRHYSVGLRTVYVK